jgi:uncharacterized SAM-binding protein YcdF (DUF218 family)
MNTLLIIALELGKAILVPSMVLVSTMAIGTLLLWSPLQGVGRWITTIASIIFLVCAMGPLSGLVARPLETRFPPIRQLPNSVQGIILLGGAFEGDLTTEWNQPQLNSHAGRLTAFLGLARQYPNLQLIFSGGSPAFSDKRWLESDIARDLFASLGVTPDRILFENRSRNTCENAIYTAQLVKPSEQQMWVLVTSAMDMPRAVGAFRKVGFRILPYPVDYTTGKSLTLKLSPTVARNLGSLDHAIHEWLGLLAYHLMHCSDSLFPGPLPSTRLATPKPNL